MKNRVIIILTAVLTSMVLFSGNTFAQYNDRYGYEDEYRFDSNVYDDYEYWLDNAPYHLDRCQGPVYYYYHPVADVYFVSIGNVTFVVPSYQFRPYMHRHNFFMVPRSRFISLSCGGLDYYDNYLRFNFYFDFFNSHRWDRKYYHTLRYDYRKYYNNRHHNSWYEKNRRVVMKQRISPSHHNGYSYSNRGGSHDNSNSYRSGANHKSDGYRSYNHGSTSYSKKYNYSKSSSSKKTHNRNYGSHKYGKDRH